MTDLDRLPPDQRAVLSLVLDRGKSYGEVAELLGIPEGTVRDRAHAALDALANDAALAGSSRVASSRPARPGASRAGAVGVTGAGTAGVTGAGTAGAPRGRATGATGPGSSGIPAATIGAASPSSPRPREPRRASTSAGSRRAGALLLAAIIVVIVVVVVLVSSGGGGKGAVTTTSSTTSPTSTSTSSTKSAGKPSLDKTIQLASTEPAVHANGTAYVLSEGSKRAFYVTAQGLAPSSGFFYAVWLYNSPSSSEPLGRASDVGSDGRMQGGNPLPSNASDYAKFIVTRETSTHPSHPGPMVLSGPFSLH